jgi:hypothetical protein
MRIKVRDLRSGIQGLHPKEAMVVIDTLTGPEELVIFNPSGGISSIEVGHPIAVNADNFLVELPSETGKGAWRVWVNRAETEGDALEAAE